MGAWFDPKWAHHVTIAIYGRQTKENACSEIKDMLLLLNKLGVNVMIDAGLYKFLHAQLNLPSGIFRTFSGADELKDTANFLLSLGGDGTLLETLGLVRNSGIPVLGINTGRLGFLAGVPTSEISAAIHSLLEKKYTLDKRTLLQVHSEVPVFSNLEIALNEINVHARDSSTMITIHTYINGEYLNSYWADGLIVATPTGSTAYSLSCGGPLMIPASQSLIITPISPHNLNARPLVIADTDHIRMEVESRSKTFRVSLDSRTLKVDTGIAINVRKADFMFNLVRLEAQNFIQTLRNKLYWGIDKRN